MTQPSTEPGSEQRPEPQKPTGILLIDKPVGPSSMGMCRLVRGRLKAAGAPKKTKVGHGGTLDPLASGLVVILVGRATPLCDVIMAGEKRYLATVDLAHRSDTDDNEGVIEPVAVDAPPDTDRIRAVLRGYTGTIQQVPPAHSAVKIDGKRAYALARSGKQPELKARPVTIDAIEIVAYTWPRLQLDIRCGKGTYIRSLARDIGHALGTGGMLAALRRTRVGRHDVENAYTPESLPDPLPASALMPIPADLTPASGATQTRALDPE